MDSNDLMLAGMLALAALSVGAIVYLLLQPYLSGERRTDKRIQAATENKGRRIALKQQVGGGQQPPPSSRRHAEGARGPAEAARKGVACGCACSAQASTSSRACSGSRA